MTNPYKKIALSLVCLTLAALAWFGTVDDIGREYTDQGFKRALVTFAVARSLNGVISVAQGTEVAIEPAGIGINFTPGQILDPINDLIERFSWIMLASSTSLGLQKMLLAIFSSIGVTILIMSALGLAILALWYRGNQPAWIKPLIYRVALVMVVVRFAIPLVALTSETLFHLFLQEQYTQSTQHIERTTEDISRVNRKAEADRPIQPNATLLERAQRMVDSAASTLDVQGYIERYKAAAADASEHAINLIVIFTLQTIFLPLMLLWLMMKSLKGLLRLNLFG